MSLNFRFAIASDLHIGLPETIWEKKKRFHLIEISIPAFELVLEHLTQLQLDFLLLPGDLTQHGEPENHKWLQQRLASLPFPVYVVPGNHDVPSLSPTSQAIGWQDFPSYYQQFGYTNQEQLYYSHEILPGVQLIALNSNQFSDSGEQLGCLDTSQLIWLEQVLESCLGKLVLVMIHHNVIEHLPNQAQHPLGKRYMLDNASELLQLLQKYGVKLIFSGHLHVQDIAHTEGIYEVTTGSLVSYPHPYRILEWRSDNQGQSQLQIQSHRLEKVPGWDNLTQISREWLGEHSYPFMMQLLTTPPLNLPPEKSEILAEKLRYFWADIAAGDAWFNFPEFPEMAQRYFQAFSAITSDGNYAPIDNHATLKF